MTTAAATPNPSACALPWWKQTTVYQVYPRSFCDTNGDGIGDLRGVLSKLDVLAELGVETLWLTPFFDSPGRDLGYDVRDYRKIGAESGTFADLVELRQELSRRGMRLVFDLVLNHTSDQHPWFQQALLCPKSPERDYYLFRKGKGPRGDKPPNNWRSMIGPSGWQRDPTSGDYYFTSFLPFQPDLNHRNPAVTRNMLSIVRFFLEQGADGLRLDIFNALLKDPSFADNPFSFRPLPSEENPDGFFQQNLYTINHKDSIEFARTLRAFVDSVPEPGQPDGTLPRPGKERFLVGEVFGPPKLLRSYLGMPDDGLNLVFLFKTLRTPFSAEAFFDLIEEYEREFPAPLLPTWVLGNHDKPRYIERLGNDARRAKVLSTLQLCARGVPFVYQGEEIGMTNLDLPADSALDPLSNMYGFVPTELRRLLRKKGILLNRDECRTPMQWSMDENAGFAPPGTRPFLPVHPGFPFCNVEAQRKDPTSLFQHYKRLFALRRAFAALHGGSLALWHKTSVPKGVLAFTRQHEAQTVFVLLHFADDEAEVRLPFACEPLYSTHGSPLLPPSRRLRLRPFEAVLLTPIPGSLGTFAP